MDVTKLIKLGPSISRRNKPSATRGMVRFGPLCREKRETSQKTGCSSWAESRKWILMPKKCRTLNGQTLMVKFSKNCGLLVYRLTVCYQMMCRAPLESERFDCRSCHSSRKSGTWLPHVEKSTRLSGRNAKLLWILPKFTNVKGKPRKQSNKQ